jgi:hypothetical protein
MFLGWYDPDKKYPTRAKLVDALDRYAEKFGTAAEVCLTNPADAAELAGDPKAPVLPVRAVAYIPRFTYYVGVEDPPVAPMAEAA